MAETLPAEAAESARFAPLDRCWVCGGRRLERYHAARLDFTPYATQDPGLHAYTGERVWLVRCRDCGFGQPEVLPTLPRYFDRMYDQRWSDEWVEAEFEGTTKDFIFGAILRELARRVPGRGRLLDVGAHAGRFLSLAQQAGWQAEGIELNPKTAACAARRTGAPVHRMNAHDLARGSARYAAITITDVLEHIPAPAALLADLHALLEPGGVLAVKVPCGRSQWIKERVLAAVSRHQVSLADNLVHVNHFTPGSLRQVLQRAGFSSIVVQTGAPELPPAPPGERGRDLANAGRRLVYAAGRLPGGVHTPLALNLQAYATTPFRHAR
jgi:SAM-dependent methyltransferase